MNVKELAAEINARASGYSIGELQNLRAKLKGLKRVPGTAIFSGQTTFDDWAFHHGGRSELQFNVGTETSVEGDIVRFGLAFSFETSQSLPSIDVLVPKVALFNEYVRAEPDALSGFEMWHFQDGQRSLNRMPSAISADLVRTGTFVFLGGWCPSDAVDVDGVLGDLDRLLPLYQFVESGGIAQVNSSEFMFRAGNNAKKRTTVGNLTAKALSIDLRHNELQEILYRELCAEFGRENVGTEVPSGTGGRIDAVSRENEKLTFYEIKVGHSVKALLREAIGQLLEYSIWPGANEPASLVVVGEPKASESAEQYLKVLNESLPFNVSYRQLGG